MHEGLTQDIGILALGRVGASGGLFAVSALLGLFNFVVELALAVCVLSPAPLSVCTYPFPLQHRFTLDDSCGV